MGATNAFSTVKSTKECKLGCSNFDLFLRKWKMQRQKKVPNFNLKLFNAGVFPYFEPFSRRLALKFKNSTNRAKKNIFYLIQSGCQKH
jgi:hypothetical protein